jgi:hypothetical protein
LEQVCPRCQTPAWTAFFSTLGPALEGEVLTRVDRIQVTAPLSEPAGRFSALKQAAAFELKSPEAVKAALRTLAKAEGFTSHGQQEVSVSIGASLLTLGVQGSFFYATNDEPALAALAPVFTAKPTLPAHALDAALDPKALASALNQISLLDVVADRRLVALFALRSELGPLLEVSDDLRAWAQPQSTGVHLHLSWRLSGSSHKP